MRTKKSASIFDMVPIFCGKNSLSYMAYGADFFMAGMPLTFRHESTRGACAALQTGKLFRQARKIFRSP